MTKDAHKSIEALRECIKHREQAFYKLLHADDPEADENARAVYEHWKDVCAMHLQTIAEQIPCKKYTTGDEE